MALAVAMVFLFDTSDRPSWITINTYKPSPNLTCRNLGNDVLALFPPLVKLNLFTETACVWSSGVLFDFGL